MDKEWVEEFCRLNPNARPAKTGFLIETEQGLFHLTNIIKMSDYEDLGEQAGFYASFCSFEDIKRILHPKSADDFLLKVRAEAIVDNPRLIRVFMARKAKKTNWSLSSYYSERNKEENYLSQLFKEHRRKLCNVPAGSAYLNCVNAMCMKTEGGNIITISEPLEYFLYFMNIFFYGEHFGMEEKDIFASYLIAHRIMAGYESFDFDLDSRGVLPNEIELYVRFITDLQYQFVLGHEYSHHLLGHLNESKLVSESMAKYINTYDKKSKVKHYKYSHKLEYDADWYAIKNIKGNALFRDNLANAAFLLLMYFDISNTIMDYIKPKKSNVIDTHPSPKDRIYKLRSRLNNKLGFSKKEIEDYYVYLKSFTEQFLSEFLPFHMDDFEKYGSVYLPNYKKKLLIDRIDF